MLHSKKAQLMCCLLLLALAVLSVQVAEATVVSNGNAFVPNTTYNGGTTSTTNTTTTTETGTKSTQYLTPEQIAALTGSTGTTGASTSSTRNAQYLTPEEAAKLATTTTTSTRDKSYLVAGETPVIPTAKNRANNFLIAGESPKDEAGNALVIRAGSSMGSTGTAAKGSGGSTGTSTGPRIVNCKEWVNVRASASTSAKIVGKAYLNESITIQRWNSNNTWAYINYSGGAGWVKGTFIQK